MTGKSNVGTLIRDARTAKKLSQEQLASQIDGLSASDVSKAERGEKVLSQTLLRAIAKVVGVTQKSLLEAPAGGTGSTSKTAAKAASKTTTAKAAASKTASKTTSAKTTSAKSSSKPVSKTEAAKTASKAVVSQATAAAKKAVSAKSGEKETLTAAEKKFLDAYRDAKSDDRKIALKVLKDEPLELQEILPLVNSDDGILRVLRDRLQNLMK